MELDPNDTLRAIRAIINDEDEGFRADSASDLQSLIGDLDEWLSGGGDLPDAWL